MVDDDHVVGRGAAQADVFGGIGVAHPVVTVSAAVEHLHVGQIVQDFGHLPVAEGLLHQEGQFEGGALEVAHQDHEVVRIDGCVFRAAPEEIAGVVDDVLVGTADMSALDGTLAKVQPYFQLSKAVSSANTGVATMNIDWVKITQDRE